MTAEPLHDAGDDPAEILRVLPETWHEQFLGEYHRALDAAHEVWRFHQLRDLLHVWRLRAVAFSNPDFESAAQAARERRSEEFVPAENVIPGWNGRL
ncbi:DUF6247 family protein [Sphaerisporangium perillae]|uniref:DUF6247 family protein n=1 Tax=Sphaerisporangium perillae TaxID=2935860 RepID=UPI00200CFF3F|nr:DUF6247 family protein [Sphaerisporangium perillae]